MENEYTSTPEEVTITREEYDGLWEDRAFLRALTVAGVNNWSGYDYAQDLMKEWRDE